MEKNEAQLKNEEEVRRIMQERGYDSPIDDSSSKFPKGTVPKIISVVVLALVVFTYGWFVLKEDSSVAENSDNLFDEAVFAEEDEEMTRFRICLGAIDDSEIPVDDAGFWDKLIERYEQTISCYDKYPSMADSSEKEDLQNNLAKCRESAKSENANNVEYRANMAQIDIELAQKLTEIKERGDNWDKELLEKVQERQAQSEERQSQYAKEQSEREAKQRRCDSFKAEYPDIDAYKSKNGNLNELWMIYQDAKSKYNSALNAYGNSNPNHSDEWRDAIWKGVVEKETIMNNAYMTWSTLNKTLSANYNSEFSAACL